MIKLFLYRSYRAAPKSHPEGALELISVILTRFKYRQRRGQPSVPTASYLTVPICEIAIAMAERREERGPEEATYS